MKKLKLGAAAPQGHQALLPDLEGTMTLAKLEAAYREAYKDLGEILDQRAADSKRCIKKIDELYDDRISAAAAKMNTAQLALDAAGDRIADCYS
jgi:hypothetical protein